MTRVRKEIKLKVSGLDSEDDWNGFVDRTASFWAELIEKNVNELSISYDEKLKLIERVLRRIRLKKNMEEENQAVL